MAFELTVMFLRGTRGGRFLHWRLVFYNTHTHTTSQQSNPLCHYIYLPMCLYIFVFVNLWMIFSVKNTYPRTDCSAFAFFYFFFLLQEAGVFIFSRRWDLYAQRGKCLWEFESVKGHEDWPGVNWVWDEDAPQTLPDVRPFSQAPVSVWFWWRGQMLWGVRKTLGWRWCRVQDWW